MSGEGERGAPRRILLAGIPPEVADWVETDLRQASARHAEGYQEALRLIVGGGFDLLVLDERLAGGSGEALLREVRERGQLADLPILFCVQPPPEQELARRAVEELGVAQLMMHPLDRAEFVRQAVRLRPELAPAPAPADVGETAERLRSGMAELWAKYRETILGRVAVLESAVMAQLEAGLDPELRRAAEREAHKLAGSVGTFGYMDASGAAREVEEMLAGNSELTPAATLRLSDLVLSLRRQLEGADPRAAAAGSVTVPERSVVVFALEPELARGVTGELVGRGFHPVQAGSLPELRRILATGLPAAALVDLSDRERVGTARLALRALGAHEPHLPIAVLVSGESLEDRVEAAALGARAFLQSPIAPARLAEEIQAMLQRAQPRSSRVLAVDDDPHVLEVMRTTLAAEGWEVETLADPLSFWSVLESVRPDLLVLDIDMPHLTGIELCRVVRRDPRWETVPILFLTARTGAEVVQRVYAAGADDFVNKPILGPELVGRIRNRLERAQIFRSLAETDYLTGLPNRRKATELLEQLRRLAIRHRQPLCVAVIDLDRFKEVNDRFGHPAGDEVLVRLADHLQRTFRGEDVVARWGGEEFILGMYGMGRGDGVARLRAALDRFGRERFTAPGGERFAVTFSAGVAEAPPDGAELPALYQAADAALYRAKAEGRARVLSTADEEGGAHRVDVVLVEDDETLAGLLEHALRTRGYQTHWIQGGHHALEALTGNPPAVLARLILLDVDLPGIDGLSLLRRLVREGVTRATPVIMLTARAGEPEVLEALKVGAVDHVAKPFSIPVLMERVKRVLDGRR